MTHLQFINQMLVWEKRLEIEDKKRKFNHLRASNGSVTFIKRSGRPIPASEKDLFQVRRWRHPFYSCHSQDGCEKTH